MSFDTNVKINLIMAKKLHAWIQEFSGDNEGYLEELYNSALGYLLGKEHENNWDSVDYFAMHINSPLFIANLKEFDMKLGVSEYTPDWGLHEPHANVLDFPPDRVEETISNLKKTGDLFYFYVMMLVYFGGITIYHHMHQSIPFFEEDLERYFRPIKVYVTAKKMEKEFSEMDVHKAYNYTSLVEPIDDSEFSPYLLEDTTAVIHKEGKYYLTEDVLKALTATGGVAQALERQDLEGGMENAASKQARPRKVDGRTTTDAEKDTDRSDS